MDGWTRRQTLTKLQGHMRKVNDIKFHAKYHCLISASGDKTVRVWNCSEPDTHQYRCAHTIRKHKGEVYGLSVHPLQDYFVSCSSDKTWAFFEMDSGRCLRTSKDLACDYRCLSFHPDGMILGAGGSDGAVHIWDMKGTAFRAALTGHAGPINGMSFSENGYYLATASEDGSVRLWDLRKSLSFQTISEKEKKSMTAVAFDYSGQYIATASFKLSLYYFESRANAVNLTSLTDHNEMLTDVCFGPSASMVISTSMDRTVRLWESSEN